MNFKLKRRKLILLSVFIMITFLGLLPKLVLANELTAYEQEAARLLNVDRAANGLPALKVDMKLVRLARDHAADLINRDYFSHTNPDGQSPFDRIKKADIKYRLAGENLAINRSVAEAQKALMQSTGHRENILREGFTHVGIGVHKHSNGSLYLVQIFIGI